MNWEQILTEHTKKTESGYVQTKEIDASIFDDMCRASSSWNCCAVGSFMQDRVVGWNEAAYDVQDNALDLLQDNTGIDLNVQGTEFYDQLCNGHVGTARTLYEKIKDTVRAMDQTDIILVGKFLRQTRQM